MNISIFLAGFSFFFICLALHAVLWRLKHPKNHALALLAVFFLPLPLFAALFVTAFHASWPDLAAALLLHAALSCSYIQIYPAAQAFSPTLVMLILAHRAGPKGITRRELETRLGKEFFLGARIQDLLHAGLAAEREGLLSLTPQGLLMIRFFIAFRACFGLGMGKG